MKPRPRPGDRYDRGNALLLAARPRARVRTADTRPGPCRVYGPDGRLRATLDPMTRQPVTS